MTNKLSSKFTKPSFPPLFRSDGSVAIYYLDKANLFGSVFFFNSTLDNTGSTPSSLTPSNHTLRPIYISFKDVVSALSDIDTRKAYGHDGIPTVVLKTCSVELAPFRAKLFRLSKK